MNQSCDIVDFSLPMVNSGAIHLRLRSEHVHLENQFRN